MLKDNLTAINLFTHRMWGSNNKIYKADGHLFHKKTNKLNYSGIIHLIFSTIEMAIIISILLLAPILPFIFAELFFVFLFEIIIFIGSKKINSKIGKLDLATGLIVIVSVLVKMVILIN